MPHAWDVTTVLVGGQETSGTSKALGSASLIRAIAHVALANALAVLGKLVLVYATVGCIARLRWQCPAVKTAHSLGKNAIKTARVLAKIAVSIPHLKRRLLALLRSITRMGFHVNRRLLQGLRRALFYRLLHLRNHLVRRQQHSHASTQYLRRSRLSCKRFYFGQQAFRERGKTGFYKALRN